MKKIDIQFRTAFVSKKDFGGYLSKLLDQYIKGEVSEDSLKRYLVVIESQIFVEGRLDATLSKHYLYKKKSDLIIQLMSKNR